MATYGVDPKDGTLSPCKAKPENRGRGNCYHEDHHELDQSQEVIDRFNEEKLKELYGAPPVHKKAAPTPTAPKPPSASLTAKKPGFLGKPKGSRSVPSPGGGRDLSQEEFRTATRELAEAFPEEDWDYINQFYQDFNELVTEEELQDHTNFKHATESLHAYLSSDGETPHKIREFLGSDVDLKTFSFILVSGVKSMRMPTALRNDKGRVPLVRIVNTSLNNDMTRERYVASVLFFGGRCCYCNCVLTKNVGADDQATGEHITPLTPSQEGGVCSGTRYGNMALACMGCNNERGNKALDEWIHETKRVSAENKDASLDRIKKFRAFALYREYTPEESAKIMGTIDELRANLMAVKRENGVFKPEDFKRLKMETQSTIFQLQQELHMQR